MRALLKLMAITPLLFLYLLISGSIRLLPVIDRRKRAVAVRTSSFFSRIMLSLLGVRVHVKHRERLRKTGDTLLIVSNHLSYVDVLVILSLMPSVFITSVELKNTALLGLLARLNGSIFVERRKPSGLKEEIRQIARALGQGMPVALFPEGTTSNGDRVHQFKNSLFDSAVTTRSDIMPLCLRYTGVNGERLTPRNRDNVYYYGGITFPRHFPRLLKLKSIDIEVVPLKPIRAQAHHSRKDLAAEAHRVISAAYHG